MRVAGEVLIMLAQCDYNMKLNRQPPSFVSNSLQLCSIQDALTSRAIAVEVGRKRQGTATFSIVEEEQVRLGRVGKCMASPNH